LLFFHIVCVSSPPSHTYLWSSLWPANKRKIKMDWFTFLFPQFLKFPSVARRRGCCWVVVVVEQVLWKVEKRCVCENPGLQYFLIKKHSKVNPINVSSDREVRLRIN
jgi:hypothetical protein